MADTNERDLSPSELSNRHSTSSHIDTFGTAMCVLLALVTIGLIAFRIAPVLPVGASRNYDRALFSSINITTLTGFTQSFASVSDFPPAGQWLITICSLVSAVTILAISGRFLARVFGIEMSIWKLLFIATGLLLVCSLPGLAVDAFSAITSSNGLGLMTVRSPDASLQTLLISMSVPASVGLIVLGTLFGVLKPTKRKELASACAAALVVVYLLGLITLHFGGMTLAKASLAAIDTRSLGSGFVPVASGSPTQWTMAGLMLLGAGPGGVAGGLGVLPIVVLIRSGWSALREKSSDPILGVAVVWIAVFFVGLFALIFGLSATQPQLPGDRMFFLAVSAICNVGLSHDPVSLTREGLYLLASGMVFGRVLPLAMLCWMACVSDRATLKHEVQT